MLAKLKQEKTVDEYYEAFEALKGVWNATGKEVISVDSAGKPKDACMMKARGQSDGSSSVHTVDAGAGMTTVIITSASIAGTFSALYAVRVY